ncbi:MAG: hypothetical protein JXB60_05300 [Candidatus Cloacimonetes bacterium]|nr:hypothetical protein [Candidatus Cloacimonadota bacterium]
MRIRIAVTVILVIMPFLVAAEYLEVISQDVDGLVLQFTLPDYYLEEVRSEGEIYNRIHCDESGYNAVPGYPLLPVFTGIIGLPVDGDYSIRIINQEHKILKGNLIYPAEGFEIEANSMNYHFHRENRVYNSRELYPARLVEKGAQAYIKDRYFASFLINPFQCNCAGKQLVITSSIKFSINISGDKRPGAGSSHNFIDQFADDFFLNNEFSRQWRRPKEKGEYLPNRQDELVHEIQLIVDTEGIYKVSFNQIDEALTEYALENDIEFELGFSWDNIDPVHLELSNEFGSVPIYFPGEKDGIVAGDDYFEFYGYPHYGDETYYDDFTSENTYVLCLIGQLGSRMAVENGGLEVSNNEEYYIPLAFQYTAHFEEQEVLDRLGAQYDFTSHDFYREDIWFWSKISAPNLSIFPFQIQYPYLSNIRGVNARVSLFGLTYNPNNYYAINHHAIVRINSSIIGNKEWYGQSEMIFENEQFIPNSYLLHGENTLYVSLPGIPGILNEQVMLDYMDITYWREYKTDDDILKFTKPQNKPVGLFQFELDNFSSDSVFVYKIGSSIIENLQIEAFFETGGAPFKVSFQDEVNSPDIYYYAVTESQKKQPVRIRPNLPSDLKNPLNGADYVIITAENMVRDDGTVYFEQMWEERGHEVEIVNLQDIFDEFNYGIRSVESIKDFLSYAYNNWSEPELTHVMLLGDGLLDERDDSVDRIYNIIPFRNVWIQELGAIASDNWMACIVGDDPVADISISRINVWEIEQILPVAEKSANYLSLPNYDDLWHSHITLAAGGDASDGSFFARQCERIKAQWIPEDFNTSRVYCNTQNLPSVFLGNTTSLITNINNGTLYLTFMGHGGGQVWADYNLLTKNDVATFNNDNYPFVSSLSCFASAFNYPQSSCLGEELVLIAGRGAIGHVGFTGYGYKYSDEDFGKYLAEAIFAKQAPDLGAIVDFAKAKFFAQYYATPFALPLTQGCSLMGDPMISLELPTESKQVLLNHYNPAVGDTLIMHSPVGPNIYRGKFVIFDEDDAQLPLDEYYPFELPAINDTIWSTNFLVTGDENSVYTNAVKLFAYGENMEVTGISKYTVGRSAVNDIQYIPDPVTAEDSISITADFYDEEGIASVICNVLLEGNYPMVNVEDDTYETAQLLPPHPAGSVINFYFIIEDALGDTTHTSVNQIHIAGPDLYIQFAELNAVEYWPSMNVLIQNIGSIAAPACTMKIYDILNGQQLVAETIIGGYASLETRWEYVELPLFSDNIKLKVVVNENEASFDEILFNNNTFTTGEMEINMFLAGMTAITASSLDENVLCQFPANLLDQEAVFFIQNQDQFDPINQPDIDEIMLHSGSFSTAYEINTLNESLLADSLGHFPGNQRITLQYYYNSTDSLTQIMENSGNFYIYRWEGVYEKWVYQGGQMNTGADMVEFLIDRTGIYTIYQNNDLIIPEIEANVEGQEFTNGGYLSKNGIISFLLTDANGIDVFSNTIFFEINGMIIPSENYTISLAHGNLTHVPLKYDVGQLDLSDGEHYLNISCTDVNGRFNNLDITFEISTDFDLIRLANYPNPVISNTIDPINEGRTRFTYILTDDADEVYLKIYTVSGRLVKTFHDLSSSVGYHEFPRAVLGWDCRDESGVYLANGIYFYRITAKKGGKKIERTQKMAILK